MNATRTNQPIVDNQVAIRDFHKAARRILVAGIGNIFLGDDGFGVEVVRALSRSALAENVRVIDFGTRSYDLAYALTEPYDIAILVDAAPRGGAPGTVYLIEIDLETLPNTGSETLDGHSLNPLSVLSLAQSLGGIKPRLYLVGCEPAMLECTEGALGVSDKVRAAIPDALNLIESLLHDSSEAESSTNVEQLTQETAGSVPR